MGAAFLWGYMATQLLGGRLADRYGGKRVIAGAIAFFSIASVLPPLLANVVPASSILTLVIASRFLGSIPSLLPSRPRPSEAITHPSGAGPVLCRAALVQCSRLCCHQSRLPELQTVLWMWL